MDDRTAGLEVHDPALPRALAGHRGANEGSPGCEVATRMSFAESPAQMWKRLRFYEQIDEPPPLHLRLLLPAPIETIGRKTHVGDEARCLYRGCHLIKRVTAVEPGRRYSFEVIEQALAIGGGIRLLGGGYTLSAVPRGTEIEAITRYSGQRRPRWLWKTIEVAVCHSFHRHILRAMGSSEGAR
jgi:hypothetical protein